MVKHGIVGDTRNGAENTETVTKYFMQVISHQSYIYKLLLENAQAALFRDINVEGKVANWILEDHNVGRMNHNSFNT